MRLHVKRFIALFDGIIFGYALDFMGGAQHPVIGKYGLAIFGPVAKFILADYLANFIIVAALYSVLLIFVAKANPVTFWEKAFALWLIAFSACIAALEGSLDIKSSTIPAPASNCNRRQNAHKAKTAPAVSIRAKNFLKQLH